MTEPGTGGPTRRILLATTNPHKIVELRALLAGAPFTIGDPNDLGLDLDVEETGTTFAANATLKALAWAHAAGMVSLADDSGLEVDAMGGAPGVYSARWPAPGMPYPERFKVLVAALDGLPPERRSARYRCVIVVADPQRVLVTAEGTVEGRIALAPRGTGGFGYDPIFELPESGRTFGETPPAEKHQISHRARAVTAAVAALERLIAADPTAWPAADAAAPAT
jgi:XTP/dITP diphosphohydrolase